jgi:hypothetical protein
MVEKRLIVFKEPFLTKFMIGDPQEMGHEIDDGINDPLRERKPVWGNNDG